MHRDDIECGLEFAGFVVTSSPINKGSLKCIRSVISSSHKVHMLHTFLQWFCDLYL